ncbi:MAG: sulfur carrier protein ThiS [Phycisphaerales bacterium]|nr:sulfur carrier protein ThiS [Phycisphaerae bacterium]NNM24958.1 sulfur carrier protein ThiS [Phycisphaerales bacterium]
MMINVNGRTVQLEAAASVRTLLEELELGQAACAVEVNKRLVPHRTYGEHALDDGDEVEIVTFVGGG